MHCRAYIYNATYQTSRSLEKNFYFKVLTSYGHGSYLCHVTYTTKSCNSYTMGCPPVRGDNPRAVASELSYVQVDNHGINILTTYISVDLVSC